jgi:hypothetical protein
MAYEELSKESVNFMGLLLIAIHDSPIMALHECPGKDICPVAYFVLADALRSINQEQSNMVAEIDSYTSKSTSETSPYALLSLDPDHVWGLAQPQHLHRGEPFVMWFHTPVHFEDSKKLGQDLRDQVSRIERKFDECVALNRSSSKA